jgi:hypothetical protein
MHASAVTFWRWLTGQQIPLSVISPSGISDGERRVWLRYEASLSIRCGEVSGEAEEGVYAVICDISRGGIQMIAPRRFEPGSVLSVELPSPRGQSTLAVLACVVRAYPHGDSEWKMGCRFSAELDDGQLQAFGATRARPPSSDPRSWARFPCDIQAVYHHVNGDDQTPRTGRVLNIAAAGMALLVDEEVAIGELLSTELHDTAGKPALTILACVVHVSRSPEGQVLGCNFIRELSHKDLQAML